MIVTDKYSAQPEQGRQTLYAGYGKVDITPDYAVSLGGYGNYENRRANGVLDPIYMTCIALTQGKETVLLYTIDNQCCGTTLTGELRKGVALATGVSADRIFFGATHCHSCPIVVWFTDEASERYRAFLSEAAAQAGLRALEDRAPATVLQSKQLIEGLNFCRHYKLADGTTAGSNYGRFDQAAIVGHAAEADRQMVLVRFAREEKKDILLVNWQAHVDHAGENGFLNISADFPGAMRTALESETDMQVAYFTGASGNMSYQSRIPEENPGLTMTQYGQELARRVLKALPLMTPVSGQPMAAKRFMLQVNINHAGNDRLEEAREVVELWLSEGKPKGHDLAIRRGFSSVYHASSVAERAKFPETEEVELSVFCVAGVAFAGAPNEMFAETAMHIKEQSPFDTTFIVSGNEYYIPTRNAFRHGCYEADISRYTEGTAERIGDALVEALKELKADVNV